MADRLPAISGLAAVFSKGDTLGRYFAGHWEASLPNSLLWKRAYDASSPLTCTTYNGKVKRLPGAPTWSWASLEPATIMFSCATSYAHTRFIGGAFFHATSDPYGAFATAYLTLSGRITRVNVDLGFDCAKITDLYGQSADLVVFLDRRLGYDKGMELWNQVFEEENGEMYFLWLGTDRFLAQLEIGLLLRRRVLSHHVGELMQRGFIVDFVCERVGFAQYQRRPALDALPTGTLTIM
ncbi:hypothetical protein GE09DRAFT_344879 [Coniochaeta sp. 2T2.1]|nr:hypothetical protein GE09DRAFT_344879 [Coniochaeta sp. 2T2.1]